MAKQKSKIASGKRGKRQAVDRSLHPVVGRDRFLVTVIGDCNPAQAFYFCSKVAEGGRMSICGGVPQHCFATAFSDGTMVYVRRNRSGSEQFTVQAPSNPSHHDGAAPAPSVDGVVGGTN